jgi:hypothetical protein
VQALLLNRPLGRIGSVFWEPIPIPPSRVREQMTVMANQLWHTVYPFVSLHRKPGYFTPGFYSEDVWRAYLWSEARMLAPNGTGFAFLTKTYQRVGPFDERMRAFHEESDFGARCAKAGMFALGLPYPRTYHAVSRTFLEQSATVNSKERFAESEQVFMDTWNVPEEARAGRASHAHFKWVNAQFLDPIPTGPVYLVVPDEVELESVKLPIWEGAVDMPVLRVKEVTL